MKEINFYVPSEYPLVILTAVIICFECIIVGYVAVVPKRIKYFNKEFMSKFRDEHKLAFGN